MPSGLKCAKQEMVETACHLFGPEGRCCGESVLSAACQALGVRDNPIIPSVALGFGGGMGLTGRVCGAFSGAICGIGIATGLAAADYAERKGHTFDAVAKFLERCAARWKSVDCKAICGLDLTTPEGLDQLMHGGVKDLICAEVVRETAAMLHGELGRIMSGNAG